MRDAHARELIPVEMKIGVHEVDLHSFVDAALEGTGIGDDAVVAHRDYTYRDRIASGESERPAILIVRGDESISGDDSVTVGRHDCECPRARNARCRRLGGGDG